MNKQFRQLKFHVEEEMLLFPLRLFTIVRSACGTQHWASRLCIGPLSWPYLVYESGNVCHTYESILIHELGGLADVDEIRHEAPTEVQHETNGSHVRARSRPKCIRGLRLMEFP